MPSLFRKPGSPYWYAAYRNAANRRVQKTTKKTDRTEATEIALAFERLEKKGRERTLTEAHVREVLAEILERTTGATLHTFTVREWLTEWSAGKKGGVHESTASYYKLVVRDFLKHLRQRADLPISSITSKDIRTHRDALINEGRAALTVNQKTKVLRSAFGAAHQLGYIPVNPCAGMPPLRVEASNRQNFSAEQVGALVRAAEGDWKGAILMGYYTALRLRDVTNLTWGSVDLEAGVVRAIPLKTKGKMVTVPLHPSVAQWLRKRTRGIGKAPLFPDLAGKCTGGDNGLSGMFAAIIEAAGIERTRPEWKGAARPKSNLSFHSLRHSFISTLANAGISPEVRKKLSGHSDDRSHQIYTHHELEALRAAVEKLPKLKA